MYTSWNENESMLELKSRHFCYNHELESMREALLGERGMHQETTNVLYQLLSDACQERDEAREQLKRSVAEISELKKLLNKVLPSNSAETSSVVSHVQPDSQNQETLKGNLDIRGSDTVSEAYNSYSDYSSNLALLRRKSVVQDSGSRIRLGKFSSKDLAVIPASKVIDSLVKGKSMPQKGRFLEAVLDTAPLLETLVITGQLPKWRNPPSFPSSLVVNDHGLINQRAAINSKSATPSSTMLNHKKCSNSFDFEFHAGMQKRFKRQLEK